MERFRLLNRNARKFYGDEDHQELVVETVIGLLEEYLYFQGWVTPPDYLRHSLDPHHILPMRDRVLVAGYWVRLYDRLPELLRDLPEYHDDFNPFTLVGDLARRYWKMRSTVRNLIILSRKERDIIRDIEETAEMLSPWHDGDSGELIYDEGGSGEE